MDKRFITIKELQAYLGVGKAWAYKVAEQSGARIMIGKKFYVDCRKLDAYLDDLESVV